MERDLSGFFKELIFEIKERGLDKDRANQLKSKLAKKHGVREIPNDVQILLNADVVDLKVLKKALLTKPVRSISGVAVIALMSKPAPCPHGACAMCPSMTSKGVPQSYTGQEPSTRRGIRNNFDAYLMTMSRLEQYAACGHPFDKVEVIVQGGTFTAMDPVYQDGFIRDSFCALNDFSSLFLDLDGGLKVEEFKTFFELPGSAQDEKRFASVQAKLEKLKQERAETSLVAEQETNDLSSHIKCVGLTIETRPDWAGKEQADRMLSQGCTRVELGVQSVYDSALLRIKRGHDTLATKSSVRLLRDLGFKLNFHYMPGLPGVGFEEDLAGLKELFSNPDYRPDMLKLYPCMVVKDSELYLDFKAGRFKPMETEEAAKLISMFKPSVPQYCRIMRVQRDIPTENTEGGVDRTNLRQIIFAKMKEAWTTCHCIRCRETGRNEDKSPPSLKVIEYEASGGREFFISSENENALFGFVRMRIPSRTDLRPEIGPGSAIIRELHVFGKAVRIGQSSDETSGQHHGIGRELMAKAEELARDRGCTKMAVISGIGVRGYYRKIGYGLIGAYMVKELGGIQKSEL